MSEEKKVIKLNDEDLEKVNGGGSDINEGEIKFRYGDIVKDAEGIIYKILYHDSYDGSYITKEWDGDWRGTNYYCAEILSIPDSIKPFTSYNVHDNYFVNERKVNYC